MTVLLNLALRAKAGLITMPRFDLEQFLGLIQDRKATCVFIAPPIAVALGKHPVVDGYDLSSVNTVVSGSAPLDEDLMKLVDRRLGLKILQGYGMTELSPVSHAALGDGSTPLASIGPSVALTEDRLVDNETGADIEVPAEGMSELGELWVRGPQVMVGYLNNEEATRDMITEDGWLKTGDIGAYDAERNVYIVDRLKELIKYKGYQVAPAELEASLLKSDLVADAAVVGERDEDGNELPIAFVVPVGDATGEAIMAEVNERVAPYKKVRRVEIVESIPKSAAGKILRRELRVMLEQRKLDRA